MSIENGSDPLGGVVHAQQFPARKEALAVIARHRALYPQMPTNEKALLDIDKKLYEMLSALVVGSFSPPATEPPDVSRVGLGYRAEFASGITMGLERVRESRGEVHGELYVRAPISRNTFPDGHLFGARFNVSSLTARTSVGKYLSSRLKADWPPMLERFCMEVLSLERRGGEFTTVGGNGRESVDRWMLRPLLLKGKTTILFGAGGSWKSTIGAACAVTLAGDAQVVPGWVTHSADQPSPGPRGVLVLDWEDGAATWNDRVFYISVGAGMGSPEVHYLSMSRPLADELEPVAKFVAEKGIEVVIVDSVGLASGAQSEGESPAEGAFRLFAALRELGTTNLLIDHVAGAELGIRGPSNKPYGSVYKVNLARTVFEVRAERTTADVTEVLLLNTKTNTKLIAPQELRVTSANGSISFIQWAVSAPELKRALPKARK